MRKTIALVVLSAGGLWGALNFIGTLQTAKGIYEDRGVIINTIVFIATAPSPLIPAGVFAAGVVALIGLRLGWFDRRAQPEAEPQEVFIAVDQLKALLSEGTAMETAFQIPRKPNPKHAAIHDWIVRVNNCARQKSLMGIVGPKEIKKFNTPWHPPDVRRVEALLERAGHFNGVDEIGHLSFRTIWGHVKRLEELIATIEGTQVVPKAVQEDPRHILEMFVGGSPSKRPIQIAYDQLLSLMDIGRGMAESLKKNQQPIPTTADVEAWAGKLDDVAACCASVSERKELREAYHHVDMTTAVVSRLGAELEYGDRIVEIVGKIEVAKRIVDRIHREDKA